MFKKVLFISLLSLILCSALFPQRDGGDYLSNFDDADAHYKLARTISMIAGNYNSEMYGQDTWLVKISYHLIKSILLSGMKDYIWQDDPELQWFFNSEVGKYVFYVFVYDEPERVIITKAVEARDVLAVVELRGTPYILLLQLLQNRKQRISGI